MKKPMNQQNEALQDEPLLFTFEANSSPTTAHVSEPKPETRVFFVRKWVRRLTVWMVASG